MNHKFISRKKTKISLIFPHFTENYRRIGNAKPIEAFSEAAKNREMEHELDKMALKHQDDIREVKCQFKETLDASEQRQAQMAMAMDRGSYKMSLSHSSIEKYCVGID